MNKTTLTYKLNGTTYIHTFKHRVSYPTIEQFLIMEKHIGQSKVAAAIVKIENQLQPEKLGNIGRVWDAAGQPA